MYSAAFFLFWFGNDWKNMVFGLEMNKKYAIFGLEMKIKLYFINQQVVLHPPSKYNFAGL